MRIVLTVCASKSDWFGNQEIIINSDDYNFFTLESKSLLWTLHAWIGKIGEDPILAWSHDLATVQNIDILIDNLDIREIKTDRGLSVRTIKSLFLKYKSD